MGIYDAMMLCRADVEVRGRLALRMPLAGRLPRMRAVCHAYMYADMRHACADV